MPVLITRETLAAEVPKRFAEQYGPDFLVYPFGDSRKIYDALLALKQPDITGIEALCKGWTRLTCDECGKDVDAVVQVGQEPDYESETASICGECVALAAALFEA